MHLSQYKDKFQKEVDDVLDSNLSIDKEIEKNSNLAICPLKDLCIKYNYPRTDEFINIVKNLYSVFIVKEYEEMAGKLSKDIFKDLNTDKVN